MGGGSGGNRAGSREITASAKRSPAVRSPTYLPMRGFLARLISSALMLLYLSHLTYVCVHYVWNCVWNYVWQYGSNGHH
jgi:hypothetical protein